MRFVTLLAVLAATWVQPAAAVTILLTSPDAAQGVHQKVTLTGLGASDTIQVKGELQGNATWYYWQLTGGTWSIAGNSGLIMGASCTTTGPLCQQTNFTQSLSYPGATLSGSLAMQIIGNAIYVDWSQATTDVCAGIAEGDRINGPAPFGRACGYKWGGGPSLDIKVTGPNASTFGYTVETLASGPAVPEPATWLLMMLGIGGVGAVLRKRREAAFAPA